MHPACETKSKDSLFLAEQIMPRVRLPRVINVNKCVRYEVQKRGARHNECTSINLRRRLAAESQLDPKTDRINQRT